MILSITTENGGQADVDVDLESMDLTVQAGKDELAAAVLQAMKEAAESDDE